MQLKKTNVCNVQGKIHVFDFSASNNEILGRPYQEINEYVKNTLRFVGARAGIGRYGENRVIYKNDTLFNGRTVHLGVDIIVPAGTQVRAAFDGSIHSFADNNNLLDYGPTIIIEHDFGGVRFFTLYGHLSRESLTGLSIGQIIKAGQKIGEVGTQNVNGRWFEHVHFQIIKDMLGKKGDFPGVCRQEETVYWFALCPDPLPVLNIRI